MYININDPYEILAHEKLKIKEEIDANKKECYKLNNKIFKKDIELEISKY